MKTFSISLFRTIFNFSFTLVLFLTAFTNSLNHVALHSRYGHQFVPDSINSKSFKLAGYHIKYYIDASKPNACDIQVREEITYTGVNGHDLDKIRHSILSKKLPYTDLSMSIKSPQNLFLKDTKIVKSNQHKRIFINKAESQIYRDRWLLSGQLSKPAKEVTVEYSYTIQRAVMIDPVNEYDLVRITVINPFSNRLDNLKFSVYLQNFKNLENERIRIPPYSTLNKENRNNIEINTVRSLPVYGQLFMQFTLPLEITVCEPKLVQFVYYGMIAMTASFVIIAMFAFAYIYKE